MKTILLISPYWKEAHRWMVSSVKLAELWQRLGYRVIVVCMHSKPGFIVQTDSLIVYGVRDIFLKDPFNFGIAFGFSRSVQMCIQRYSPTHIIINKLLFWTSWSIIPLRFKGIKPIVITDTLVGMTWWPRAWYMKIIMGIGGYTMGLLTMKLAKKLVFFHPQSQLVLSRTGVAKKSMIIPTGIDSAAFSYNIPPHNTSEPVTITYVGRLESVKGVDDFCAAADVVVQTHSNVRVQIVGECAKDHILVRTYGDRMTFTGLRHDIPAVLQQTDIFVLPSYSEGLSNALMEAMCSGCACIATSVGGNPYLLDNGNCGLLFTPGDRATLQTHMLSCIEDEGKRLALAKAARNRIEQEFDWSIVGQKYQALFTKYEV